MKKNFPCVSYKHLCILPLFAQDSTTAVKDKSDIDTLTMPCQVCLY